MTGQEAMRGGPNRRQMLQAALGAALFSVAAPAGAAAVKTKARIVIAGAGAAGLSMANRLAALLDGASITLIDERKAHYYQPGFTLIGAGLKPPAYAESTTREFVPRNSEWIEEAVAGFEPDANVVVTASGRRVVYDFLVVATGLKLDYAAIEGMSPDLIGKDGVGSVYAGPAAAVATYREMSRFADTGGVGLFGRPATEMKCAGAPLKIRLHHRGHSVAARQPFES